MQGYFSYTLFGTQKELEEVEEKIRELAKTDEEFKDLEYFNYGIIKKEDEDAITSLTYEMPDSGNVSGISIEFDLMMWNLCQMFKDLEIEGTGYLLDCPPYARWHSKEGEDDYTVSFEPEELDIFISTDEILDENNNFITDTIEYETEDERTFKIPIKENINVERFLETRYEEFRVTFKSTCPEYEPDYNLNIIIEEGY